MDEGLQELVDEGTSMVGVVVRAVAAQLPPHVDRAELHRAGMLGLVEAARRYDPQRGVPFRAFAARRIRGAVFDALRADDWVPRSTRAAARRLELVEQTFTTADGTVCSEEVLATALGWTQSRVRRVREARERGVLVRLISDDGIDVEAIDDDPEEQVVRRELSDSISIAVASLPERERRVIVGYFLEDRSSAELALELGVSESRVSQLRSHALGVLRRSVGAERTQRGSGAIPA